MLEEAAQGVAAGNADHGEDRADSEVLPDRRAQPEQREHHGLRQDRDAEADADIGERFNE